MIVVAVLALVVAAFAVAVAGIVAVRTNQFLRDQLAEANRAVLARNLGEFDRPEQNRIQAQAAQLLLDTEPPVDRSDVMT